MLKNLLNTLSRKEVLLKRPAQLKANSKSFYNLSANLIGGKQITFSSFKNKKVLIVNTASKCGFTPQLKELEDLQQQFQDKLVVLGFPCNDFLFQEPKSNQEIQEFCSINYGVSFLMFEKVTLKKQNCSPVFEWLFNPNHNGWNSQKPTWNFCKYLIDENGNLTLFANSMVKPKDERILHEINS
jgi:glutathione peroxidase